MKLKKLWIILLALCLVGCGNQQEETGSIRETSLPTEAVEAQTTTETTEAPTVPSTQTEPPTTEPVQTEPILQPEPHNEDFVKVTTYIPDLAVDLRYATKNNFTGQQIYSFTDVYLRYGTVQKLILVQEELRQQGLSLKIWDGFRPPSAQFLLWEVYPDHTYVSDPNKGFSSHSRGNTVDLTLVYTDGREVEMPTEFDDFSKRADRNYNDCTKEAAKNGQLLETVMKKHGFKPYSKEWWHFTDTTAYDVEQAFEPVAEAWYYADCQSYISLRTNPSRNEEVITKIPAGETFSVLATHGNFAYVEYQGVYGYVLQDYIQPKQLP